MGTEERRAEGAGDFCLCPAQSSLTLDLIRRLNYGPSLRLQHFTATETSPLKRRLDKKKRPCFVFVAIVVVGVFLVPCSIKYTAHKNPNGVFDQYPAPIDRDPQMG